MPRTPLHFAAEYSQDRAVIQALLDAGADPMAREWYTEHTPLHKAALAVAASDEAGGWNCTGAKVPVQKMDGSHWRSSVFWRHGPESRNELMTPGGGRALSAFTVQSMADLGYSVDVSQASPYTLHDPAAKASAKISVSAPSILGGVRTWQFEGAERILGRRVTLDLPDNQRTWGGGSPSHAEPDLTCGAGQMNEPIYVVDP